MGIYDEEMGDLLTLISGIYNKNILASLLIRIWSQRYICFRENFKNLLIIKIIHY